MPRIVPIPALDSNYFWLLQSQPGRAYIVDPGDAAPVIKALEHLGLALEGLLITHHHWDHTDGIDDLLARWPVPVYGPHSTKIPQITQPLREGDRLSLPGMGFEILAVPGHTLDHIAYLSSPGVSFSDGHFSEENVENAPVLFCGDALFAAGCGRMFEGTPEQMLSSLNKLAALPDDTRIYCAHEYTLANLGFACDVEPDNPELPARVARERSKRERQAMTLPTTIELERKTNPFLRCHLPDVRAAAEQQTGRPLQTPVQVFAALRHWKDSHKAGSPFLDHYGRNP